MKYIIWFSLDSIAEDAELTDKATAELLEVGEVLKSSCEQAVKEYQEKLLQDEQFDGMQYVSIPLSREQ